MTTAQDSLAPGFTSDPYWWDAAAPESAPAALPAEVDVAIIGSGYCGLSAATELARSGLAVAVLEAGALGQGASTRSGGMVTGGQKLVVGGAVKGVAPERIARLLEDAIASFAHIEALIEREGLDAGYRKSGRFIAAYVPRHFDRLRRHGELLRRHTGVTVHEVPRAEQRRVIGSDFYHGGIVIDEYGGLHPGTYHQSLRALARRAGATLHSHASVGRIARRPGGGFTVETGRGTLAAREVIVATNGYTGAATPYLFRRLVPVTSYQIATEPLPPELMAEIDPGLRMISDTRRELYYIRPSPDGTRMLLGTRPGPLEQPEATAALVLHRRLVEIWPALARFRVTHCWKGRVAMTFDKIAHMGVVDGVHFAVGCNGSGVAMMTYLGHQSALKLLGRQVRPCAFDDPAFPARAYYRGWPWFLPLVGAWYELRDHLDRTAAAF